MSGQFGPPLPDDGTDPKVTRAYALDRITKAYIARFGQRRFDEMSNRAFAETMANDPSPAPVEQLGNGVTQRVVNTERLFDNVEKAMRRELALPPSAWDGFQWPPWAWLARRWSRRDVRLD